MVAKWGDPAKHRWSLDVILGCIFLDLRHGESSFSGSEGCLTRIGRGACKLHSPARPSFLSPTAKRAYEHVRSREVPFDPWKRHDEHTRSRSALLTGLCRIAK